MSIDDGRTSLSCCGRNASHFWPQIMRAKRAFDLAAASLIALIKVTERQRRLIGRARVIARDVSGTRRRDRAESGAQ